MVALIERSVVYASSCLPACIRKKKKKKEKEEKLKDKVARSAEWAKSISDTGLSVDFGPATDRLR